MRTVYLMRPYGTARLDGEQLVVHQRAEEIERVGLPQVDQILCSSTRMDGAKGGCTPWM
jgi:CRISPR/Cas system-associated endonuclease Cas1